MRGRADVDSKELFAVAEPLKKEGKVAFYNVNVTDDRGVDVARFHFTFYKIFKKKKPE